MLSWQAVRDDPTVLSLYKLRTKCSNKRCPLFHSCCQLAATYTARPVEIMFIGEGAGKVEEELREPFVGQSGALLKATITYLLNSRGLDIEKYGVAFDNIVHARPTTSDGKNRAPTEEEFKHCKRVLQENIRKLKPKVIVTLGDIPLKFLVDSSLSVAKERGRPRKANVLGHKCWVIPTWHPARVLRDPKLPLAEFVDDLRLAILSPIVLKGFPRILPVKTEVLSSVKEVKKVLASLWQNSDYIAFDTEAMNLHKVFDNKVLSIQLSGGDGRTAYVIPFYHPESPFSASELSQIKKLLKYYYAKCPQESVHGIVAHNAVFDLHILRNFLLGVRYVPTPVYDTMIQAYLLDENLAGTGSYGLKKLAYRYNYDYEAEHARALEHRNKGTLHKLSLEELAAYGGTDAGVTLQLFKIQNLISLLEGERVKENNLRLLRYFFHLMHSLFVEMESVGLPVNRKKLEKLMDRNESLVIKASEEIKRKLYSLPSVKQVNQLLLKNKMGSTNSVWGNNRSRSWLFDYTKPDHCRMLFFDVKKVKATKTGKSGKPSLDKNVLKELAGQGHEEADLLLKRNQVVKMFSSFIKPTYEKLCESPDAKDGFVRPTFHSTGTQTGRASAANPNCLIGSTRVVIDGYGAVSLSDIYKINLVGEQVVINGERYTIRNVWETVHNEICIVRTFCGRQLVGSLDHRILVERDNKLLWLPLAKLQTGDVLFCEIPGFSNVNLKPPVLADGRQLTVALAKELGEKFLETGELPSFMFSAPSRLIVAFFEGLVGRKIEEEDSVFIYLSESSCPDIYDLLCLATYGGIKAAGFYHDNLKGIWIQGRVYERTYLKCQVRSVILQKTRRVLYDLEVEGKHAFLADGIISHNSQQIPKVKGDPFTKKIRKATRGIFEAPPGFALIELDVKTSEVRGLAMLSGDPNLCKVFQDLDRLQEEYNKNPSPELAKKLKDADPHRVNAKLALGLRPEEVTKEIRDSIKVVTFGTMYGMSISSLAVQIKKSEEEAARIYNALFARLEVAKNWMEATKKKARTRLYVESPIGRRRRLYYYLIPKKSLWSYADRRAVNSPIQGFCSDLAFLGTCLFLYKYIIPNKKPWFVANTVHDSALFILPIEDIPEFLTVCSRYYVKDTLVYLKKHFGVELPIPIGIDFKVGVNLARMQDVELTERGKIEAVRYAFKEHRALGHAVQPKVVDLLYKHAQKEAPCPSFVDNL